MEYKLNLTSIADWMECEHETISLPFRLDLQRGILEAEVSKDAVKNIWDYSYRFFDERKKEPKSRYGVTQISDIGLLEDRVHVLGDYGAGTANRIYHGVYDSESGKPIDIKYFCGLRHYFITSLGRKFAALFVEKDPDRDKKTDAFLVAREKIRRRNCDILCEIASPVLLYEEGNDELSKSLGLPVTSINTGAKSPFLTANTKLELRAMAGLLGAEAITYFNFTDKSERFMDGSDGCEHERHFSEYKGVPVKISHK